mmetsp:Transcript_5953/g.12762  ORF Transcript_5953/g.12762 Transcript_5953/m.12762 type:complete len:294 (+) Transcript_5953:208-1089(+)
MPRPVHPPLAEGLQIMTVGQKIKALAISAEITFPHPYAPACTARNVGLIAPTELRSVPPQLPRLRPDARLLRAAIIPPTALTRPLSLHAAADNDLRGVVLVPVDGQLPGLLFLLRQLGRRSLVAFGRRAAGAGVGGAAAAGAVVEGGAVGAAAAGTGAGGGAVGAAAAGTGAGGGSAAAGATFHLTTLVPDGILPVSLFAWEPGRRGLVVLGGEGARAERITGRLRGRGALTVSPAWLPGAGAGLVGVPAWVLGGWVVLRGAAPASALLPSAPGLLGVPAGVQGGWVVLPGAA